MGTLWVDPDFFSRLKMGDSCGELCKACSRSSLSREYLLHCSAERLDDNAWKYSHSHSLCVILGSLVCAIAGIQTALFYRVRSSASVKFGDFLPTLRG